MRFKSVLAAFIFILASSAIALIYFVQTRSFGRLATKVITDLTIRKTAMSVGIKSVDLTLFPPGLELNRVSVSKKFSDKESFSAEFGKLGFYISLIEFEEKKLTFGEIRIADSFIEYVFPGNDDPLTEIDEKIIHKVFDITEESPVRVDSLLVENSHIFANHNIATIRRLKIFKKDENFMTRFHLSNLKPSAENPLILDEVWGDVEIGKKDISIQRLKLQHDVHYLNVKGKVLNYPKLKLAEVDIEGESQVHLKNINDTIKTHEYLQFKKGIGHVNFGIQIKDKKINGKAEVSIKELRSNFAYADNIDASLEFVANKLNLNVLNFSYNEQKLKLLSPVEIVNFNNKQYLHEPLEVRGENIDLNNAIRILGPTFEVVKGRLTGDLRFSYDEGNLFFKLKDGFVAHDLGLVVGEKNFKVVMAKIAKLKNTDFSYVNGEFQLSAGIELPHSMLDLQGFVNKKQVKFTAPNSKIDLEDFGNIANLDVKGVGVLSLDVSGPLTDVVINLKGQTKGFEILGFELDETKKDLSIYLKDSKVVIGNMESRVGVTELNGNGVVSYDDLDIALGITAKRASYSDISRILAPIISKMDFLPEDLDLTADFDTNIFGKANLKQLKVKSDIVFTDLNAYGENISSGSMNLSYQNETVSINNFFAEKGKGQIHGTFSSVLPTRRLKLDYKWDNIEISSFNLSKKINLNFDGIFSGTMSGDGTTTDYLVNIDSTLTNSEAQSYKFEDSKIHLGVMPRRVYGKANLLGRILETDFDISFDNKKMSKVKLDIEAPDIKPFAVAFFGQHLDAEEFTGSLRANLDSRFLTDFKHLDLRGNLKKLQFNHRDFSINYENEDAEIIVEDSKVKKWNLNIREPDLYLLGSGNGVFGQNVSLIHEIHFNSKILDIMISPLLSSEGFIRNIIKIDGKGGDYIFSGSSKATKLNFSVDGLPFPITDLSYSLEFLRNRLMIQDIKTSMDAGELALRGDVFFDGGVPDVNIKYTFDKAEIPILGKSSVNVSGDGIILGNDLPYTLSGQLVLNKGQIVNELNEFSGKSSGLNQVRFLPKNQESPIDKLINLSVTVKAENPVRITNSLMDVALKGEMGLTGHPSRPRADGRLYAPVNSSRVFFKSNEYLLTTADISFSPKKDIANPDFDIQALTYISAYKINLKAYGDLERISMDLTSDPSLPRNSILSLIAFGYTDEIQGTLSQNEQQNLTQVGVGSFVFDRFKITDILNKQFGLQLNLGTVVEQSRRDSLISGRSQDGQGISRSATKIELKKRLDEALSLSVSSTMGGTIGQRQSMNLNYSVSKKVQLEGIYEIRTNVDGEEDIIDNSIGGDVKFRWTFK